ncbi:MAG: hypothetical protein AVDCRST_MAG31-1973, partial [uncultured Sphingomonas sp.]
EQVCPCRRGAACRRPGRSRRSLPAGGRVDQPQAQRHRAHRAVRPAAVRPGDRRFGQGQDRCGAGRHAQPGRHHHSQRVVASRSQQVARPGVHAQGQPPGGGQPQPHGTQPFERGRLCAQHAVQEPDLVAGRL